VKNKNIRVDISAMIKLIYIKESFLKKATLKNKKIPVLHKN